MRKRSILTCLAGLFLFSGVLFAQPKLQFEELGNFKLESGKTIEDCKIGYRTFGKMNEDKSNIILFPTWLNGTSGEIASLIGPDLLVDDRQFYVIAVDALGNGVSSSPSNSEKQPGKAFPRFTIRDMVHSQHRLLTKKLGIKHIYGIIGGSMGGMQVFEWIVSYPDFMDKAVSYVGTPRLTSYDLLLWYTELMIIEEGQVYEMPDRSIEQMVASIQTLTMQTPAHLVRETPADQFHDFLTTTFKKFGEDFIADNWASQLRAMMAHDVSVPYFGYMQGAADRVHADLFVIVSKQDHTVNPQPALHFATLTHAKTLELDSDCGHLAIGCELKKVSRAVQEFWRTE